MATIGEVAAQIRAAMQHVADAIGNAENAREKVGAARKAADPVAEGSVSEEPAKAIGAWRDADTALEEAIALFTAGNDTTESYLALIGAGSGGTRSGIGSIPTPAAAPESIAPGRRRPPGVPPGWPNRTADNGNGEVWQSPGSTGNAEMVRIMRPTERYPHGYIRFYNRHGQPIGLDGKPGTRAHTHVPIREDGTFERPQGWHHDTE